jgi:glutamate-ammonia-ligase adenylyltransferase
LTSAYRAYRARIHRLSLDAAPSIVPAEEFAETRADVTALWNATLCADSQARRV